MTNFAKYQTHNDDHLNEKSTYCHSLFRLFIT